MALNIDSIIALVKLLDKDFFEEESFNKFISTKATKAFIEHENIMGRTASLKNIREEFIRLMEYDYYEDKFDFYILKNNLAILKRDLDYFQTYKEEIVEEALNRVYKIVREDMEIKTNIYIYAGGPDGGFTVSRKEVYINVLSFFGSRENLIKLLSHELYHSRKIPLIYRLIFNSQLVFKRKRYAYGILARIIEEGIACLIQHGPILFKDDVSGTLTRRNLSLSKSHFKNLNEILKNIKLGNLQKVKLNTLNIYALGYTIAVAIYNHKGSRLLDQWTVNLNLKNIIREYIKLCKTIRSLPHIDEEVINWLIH